VGLALSLQLLAQRGDEFGGAVLGFPGALVAALVVTWA
jgi:hypothetical protein